MTVDYQQIESSQRQHYDEILYQEKSFIVAEQRDFNLFCMLKPKLFIDGNQWCALYGDDLQSGIAGFGDTPYYAIIDFNKQFNKPVKGEL